MPNGSLLPTGLIKECDWLTAFACRMIMRPRGRAWRYAANPVIDPVASDDYANGL